MKFVVLFLVAGVLGTLMYANYSSVAVDNEAVLVDGFVQNYENRDIVYESIKLQLELNKMKGELNQ